MKLTFCGAARQVTGSAHLLTLDDGFTILMDCGLFQGGYSEMDELNERWHFDPKEVDCLILSHAHIDHSGRIPKLVKDGFRGTIFATHATRSLCAIMLLDSARIQEREAYHLNKRLKRRKQQQNAKPLYEPKHVKLTMERFSTVGYNRPFQVNEQVKGTFYDAGHILGSAGLRLEINRPDDSIVRLAFTGDIGRPNRPILRDPKPLPAVEYLISESTYGNKLHEGAPKEINRFLKIILDTCVKKQGKLIIPAFSVGRTQEIVYMLDQLHSAGKLPARIPVYVDSPLAVNATTIFGSHPECYDNELNEYMLTDDDPFGFNSLTYVHDVEISKKLNTSNKPCIIISSSGMMNAGRVKHHLFHNIENPKNTFLIVGYCAPNTPGGKLRDGDDKLSVFGDKLEVRANIEIMDSFSAHADRDELLEHLANHKGNMQKMFLVHGNYDDQQAFADFMVDQGWERPMIPEEGQSFEF